MDSKSGASGSPEVPEEIKNMSKKADSVDENLSGTANFMEEAENLSDVVEHREHVAWFWSFFFGKIHDFVSMKPKCAMCTFCLMYLFWLVLVVILMKTQGNDFIYMISDVPMYIRGDPVYIDTDAYKQAKDESTWDPSTSSEGVENVQSQGFPSTLQNLVLIIEIDSLTDEDDEGLLASTYAETISELETGLMELTNFDQLQYIVYDQNGNEDYRVRPNTITNLLDRDYAPWAFDSSYDSIATMDNFLNFYASSKFVNGSAPLYPNFNQTTIDTVKNYYAGYGFMDRGGYTGYETYYSFKFHLSATNYTLTNLMYLIADSGFGVNPGETAVEAAMSVHYLGVPIPGYNSSLEDLKEQEDLLGKTCYETVHDYLWSKKSSNGINLYWTCTNNYKGWYIGDILLNDAFWLMATIAFVYLYMAMTVNSFFIASMGLFMIFMVFLPGMVLYRYLAGYAYFGTLNMLVLFIMLSIGADDIFVINDTWQQERNRERVTHRFIKEGSEAEIQKSIRRRLQFTLGHAGKVMFTTSVSTMMSFISNSISSFPGIYCFGAFAATVVAINYVAVLLFMPCVLVVHELYFWTDESYACCQVKKRKPPVAKPADERRKIDIFLEEKVFGVIYNYRSYILLAFFLVQGTFIYFMSNLEPDPNEPRILPDSDPIQQFTEKFTEHFDRFVDPLKITNHIMIGIDGIDRSGTDETVPEELGKAIFTEVAFSSPQEQQFLEQICSDAETGWRYGDIEGRMVNFDVTPTLQCFMVQFRDSIYEDVYYETFYDESLRNAYFDTWYDGIVSSGTTTVRVSPDTFIDSSDISNGTELRNYFSLCFEESGPWTNRSFPIADPYNGTAYQGSCFWQIFLAWFDGDMSAGDPNYSPGKTNFDHYKDFIWAKAYGTDDDENASEGQLNFFEFTIELLIGSKTNYDDGRVYYDNWMTWLDNWKNNEDGQNSIFNGYGCYDATSDTCITSEYVEIPQSWTSSIMFTDSFIWSYYVMQNVILQECYSGIALALLFAFLVLVLATGNWLISLYATIVILCLVINVMGFTVMMGWKLGVIEAVIYIMVVGMSVDYVVHLSEAYLSSHEPLRVHASKRMLGIVGISVISGAVSTLGGIFFLILSYNQFFYKFGLNIFFLIFTALVYSLVGFTAAMSSIGPQGAQGSTVVCFYRCLSLCDKKYKIKADEIVEELTHVHHERDLLTKLPESNHTRLLRMRTTLIGEEALLGGDKESAQL